MHQYFATLPLRRRIFALVAAYAIALSGIIAGFGAGRALAAVSNSPGAVTCHTEVAGDPTSTGGKGEGNACTASCCVGCLTLLAPLPAPPAKAVGMPQSPGQILPIQAITGLAFRPQTKSHQSRAPPFSA